MNETKPEFSYSESEDKSTFVLVIDGLKVQGIFGAMKNGFKAQPTNATILNQIINNQAVNCAIQMNDSKKVYRFQIKRLPTQIVPDKSKVKYEKDKIIITLHKKEKETWKQHIESDFETIHLARN